jgi:eukaryotic-like serine/threonine-protein kinase
LLSRYDARIVSGSRVGDVLASKYRLEELLGSGGMGHVYRAVNVEIERAVAIKVLRSEHATNGPIVERFLREARAANLVRHPNVVDVVDIGRDGDGSPFIVQELLKGEDLSNYVARRGGQLSLEEIEAYLLPVIDAVAEAHAKGVVHRDIKPENVFLADQGRARVPKLLDFGISKVRLPNIKATEVGVMMGTPAYMAPEQVQGSRDADPRSDVWAFGIMLFELIAGRLPFDAEDAPALFVAIATQDVPRLVDVMPEISPNVSLVVERCVRRMPHDRYPSALELARDLRHVLGGDDVEPTGLRSIPRQAFAPLPEIPDLVPDLVLPSRNEPRSAAPKTLAGPGSNMGLRATELSNAPGLGSVPDLQPRVPSSSRHPTAAMSAPPPSSSRHPTAAMSAPPPSSRSIPSGALELDRAPPPSSKPPSSPASMPVPPSARSMAPPISAGRIAVDQALPGVMLAGSTTSSQRRPTAGAYLPDHRQAQSPPPPDTTLLIALAVVGLTSIGMTAALMTFAYQPDGWPLLAMVTKPPPMGTLVVQGGLGIVAFVMAARFSISGVKKWRGHVEGGRGAAVVQAVLAGAFFFAALQLARAAW